MSVLTLQQWLPLNIDLPFTLPDTVGKAGEEVVQENSEAEANVAKTFLEHSSKESLKTSQ